MKYNKLFMKTAHKHRPLTQPKVEKVVTPDIVEVPEVAVEEKAPEVKVEKKTTAKRKTTKKKSSPTKDGDN